MMRCALLGGVAMIALVGCGGVMEGLARDTFRRALYCPDFTSRFRGDLLPSDYAPEAHLPTPDASVLADPARRDEFERRFAEHRNEYDRSSAMYELEGCGSHVIYLCHGTRLGTHCAEIGTLDEHGAITPR
jgi:hypothetical protein